jgi:hypothetical protein
MVWKEQLHWLMSGKIPGDIGKTKKHSTKTQNNIRKYGDMGKNVKKKKKTPKP